MVHLDRRLVGVGALAAVVAALCPPLLAAEGHHGYLEALQFALLGLVAPPLVVLAAPAEAFGALARPAARLADRRLRHPGLLRAGGFFLVQLAVLVAWRLPPAVDAIAAQHAFVLVELVSLLPAGIAFWLELADSPPLVSRLGPSPARALLAAVTMWSVWTVAYLGGFSGGWYPAYGAARLGHAPAAMQQQLASGLLWFAAAGVFLPVIFTSLYRWLGDEERPDAELGRLVREDRRRALSRPLDLSGRSGGLPQ